MRKVFGKLGFESTATAMPLRRKVAPWLIGGALLCASALGVGTAQAQQVENAPTASTWVSANAQADAEANARLRARKERRAQLKREQSEKAKQTRKEREDKKKSVKSEQAPPTAKKQDAPPKPTPPSSAPPTVSAKPVLIEATTPKPFLPPAPIKKAPAEPADPLLAMGDELLYPLGMGLVLAGGLGLLGYTMRKRRDAAAQGVGLSNDMAEPPTPHTRPAPAKVGHDDHESADVIVELSAAHAGALAPAREIAPDEIPLPALRAARPRHLRGVHAAARATAQAAHQTTLLPESEEEPEPVPQSDHSEPPTERGVFKPSALFSRIDEAPPIRQRPVAPLDPLTIGFEALRLTMTLSRIELRFRITLRNDCPIPLHQIRVEACMGTTEGDMPETLQEHRLVGLLPGEEASISEEWRVPLNSLPVLRLGTMRLLVGTARIAAVLEGDPIDPPSEMTFLIGLPEDGGRLVPIPLDGVARVHDNLMVQSVSADQD